MGAITCHLDLDHLTVIYTDKYGEGHDLNYSGVPCLTRADLAAFIGRLAAEELIDEATKSGLLASLAGKEREDRRWIVSSDDDAEAAERAP